MTDQVETQTRTFKAKPLPNTAGQNWKNTVSIYLELDGLDDVTDVAFKEENLARPMFLLPSLQSRASSEFSTSLAWRTNSQAS